MPWSTVWRVADGTWLKRCKGIWRFEAPLTAALAARWPDRLPEVVEHGDDWLLLRDAGDVVEKLPHAHDAWLNAVAGYGELQRGEAAHVGEHLAGGVPDQRGHVLPAEYAAMLERDELPWRDGERERFRRFEAEFARLCDEIGDLASINHDDLHMHNVYDGGRVLDWGDSCVSHPFFSLVVTFRFVGQRHDEIRDAYLEGYGGDRAAFDLALRVGRIAHLFKWIRFRDVLPQAMLADYDVWMRDFLDPALAQLGE
jgi:hypothetical protein